MVFKCSGLHGGRVALMVALLGIWVGLSIGMADVGDEATERGLVPKVRVETSKPKPVDPREDNAWILKALVPTLVVTLQIRGTEVQLAHAQIVMAPDIKARRQEAQELIGLTGIRKDQKVTSVKIPDERINVLEKKGLVIMRERTITASVPLPERIDSLRVQLPGADNDVNLDVHQVVDDFCRAYDRMVICQPIDH